MLQEVYEAYTQIYGQNHQSTINSLINLACVQRDLQEYDLAAKNFEMAIEGRRATEGENSVNYAMAKAMAAGAYRELGDYAKAEEYIKDAYMTIVTQQGEENVPASVILNGMGLLYKRQGKFERGVDAYERALKIREELLGEDHPDALATRHSLGELYIDMGQGDKGQELLNQNVELMQ